MKTINYRSLNGLFDFKLGIDVREEGAKCLLLNVPDDFREAVSNHERLQEMYGAGIPVLTPSTGGVFSSEEVLLTESAQLIEELIGDMDNREVSPEDEEPSTSITLQT